MYKTRAALALASVLIAGDALAQTSAPATAPMTAVPAAPAATSGSFVTEQNTGEFRASKFVGLNVYGSDNQKIGDINEILIDGTGAAKAVVIGVGGFLGIGEKNVAVPFSTLEWVNNPAPAAIAATPPSTSTALGTAPTMGTTPGTAPLTTGSTTPVRSPAETAAYNGYPDHAMLRVTKAEVQNAPEFRYFSQTQSNAAAPKP